MGPGFDSRRSHTSLAETRFELFTSCCSFAASLAPPHPCSRRANLTRSGPACLRRDGGQHPPLDERERITVKPRNQNAGEGGNLRGRGNSAGAGVRYTVRPLRRATTAWGVCECVSRVPPLILTKARSPRCAKRNRLPPPTKLLAKLRALPPQPPAEASTVSDPAMASAPL